MDEIRKKLSELKITNNILKGLFAVSVLLSFYSIYYALFLMLVICLFLWTALGSVVFIYWSHNRFFKRQIPLLDSNKGYVLKNLEEYVKKFRDNRFLNEKHFEKIEEVITLLKVQGSK